MQYRRLKTATSKFFVSLVMLAAVLLGAATIMRSSGVISAHAPRITFARIDPDPNELRLHKSRRVLNSLTMKPLGKLEDAQAALASAAFGMGAPDVDAARQRQLLDAAALFLTLYAGDSPRPYKDWRREHGFTLTPRKNMIEDQGIDVGYEYWTGRPLPADLSDDDAFDTAWNAVRTKNDGASRLVAVASDVNGLAVAFKHSDSEDDRYPSVEGGLPTDIWYGNMTGLARSWWSRDRTADMLRRNHQMVLDACVSAVVQFKSGGRHPVHMRFFWDEKTGQWELEYAALSLIRAESNKYDLGYALLEF